MESTGEGGVEGGGELGLGLTEIEMSAESLWPSEMLHIVKEMIGFVLFMHHQIPSVLQHIEDEFDTLKDEFKALESVSVKESKASLQRQHNTRKREVKWCIKKLEKLMNAISNLLSALQLALDGPSDIHGVILLLGASPARPQHVYEMFFPCGRVDSQNAISSTKSRVAESLSRKAIRALISRGAGSSYTGPTKLFLLVKSSCTFNSPLHFLPKRDFKYHKKAVPFRLLIKSKSSEAVVGGDRHHTSEIGQSTSVLHPLSDDVIWFQCRHTVRGLPSKAPEAEG